MPRRTRSSTPLTCFHVVIRPVSPNTSVASPTEYRALQDRLRDALLVHPIRLVAYCLLPDRWHLVVGPTDPRRLKRCLNRVRTAHPAVPNVLFTVALPAIDDLIQAARQVERQALSANLVRRAQDWPWGSLAGRLDADSAMPLVPAPFLESRAWTDYVNAPSATDRSSVNLTHYPRRFAGRIQRRDHLGGV